MTMETGNGKKKTNAPPLRFPGFEGEWEERNLSDFVTENKERNIKGYFDKTNVLSVSGDYGIVNQIELLGRSFAGTRVSQYRVVRHGNIVYTKSPLKEYPYGIVKANMGDDGIVSTLYAVYKVNGNADEKFIQYYFSLSSRINKYFKPIVRIGAKHDMKIGNQEVLANRVVFPSLSEQRKIADFLRLLDERIAAQRVLIGEMGRLMGGIAEKVYRRKDDFYGKLGDFLEQTSKRNRDGMVKNVLSVSNSVGFVKQSEQFSERTVASDDTSGYKIVTKDDFAYNPARINVGSIAQLTTYECGIVSPMYICFHVRGSLNSTFLANYFKSNVFLQEVNKRLEGSVRQCLSFESLCEIFIPVPNIDFQNSVADALSSLEGKMANEKTVLQLFLKQKQYLLQKLFI